MKHDRLREAGTELLDEVVFRCPLVRREINVPVAFDADTAAAACCADASGLELRYARDNAARGRCRQGPEQVANGRPVEAFVRRAHLEDWFQLRRKEQLALAIAVVQGFDAETIACEQHPL